MMATRSTWRHRRALLRPDNLRAALWTWRALRTARHDLPRDGIRTRVASPPRLPERASAGAELVLRRVSPTCLERSLVLQAWLAAQGADVDVLIGVPLVGEPKTATDNPAHAWLMHEDSEALRAQFVVIHRIAASGRS